MATLKKTPDKRDKGWENPDVARMHFQTVFGLDALSRISAREYERWKLYFKIFGPIWWKRNDWNFANLTSMVSASVYEKPTDSEKLLLKFKRVKHDPLANTIAVIGAFGETLSPDEIQALRNAAYKVQ